MSAEMDLERRLRVELRTALERADGPHPTWAGSPAAARIAADPPVRRRRWASLRLMGIAATLVVIGGAAAALLLSGGLDLDDVATPGCPTLPDYGAASAQPEPPFGSAPGVTFPPVAAGTSPSVGIREPGTWLVVGDDEGPAYQMRLREVRRCDRLPDIRPTRSGGHLLLADVDVQQLRPRGLGPWAGIQDRLDYAFGDPPAGQFFTDRQFGVPGMVYQTSMQPPDAFAQSTVVVFDVPDDTSVTVHLTEDVDGAITRIEPLVGWRIQAGDAPYSFGPLPDSAARPGATASTGKTMVGATATVVDVDGTVASVTVSDVESVDGYPSYTPPDGTVIVEVLTSVNAWSAGQDAATDVPDVGLAGTRWIATDASGTVLSNLGDDPRIATEAGALSPLIASDAAGFGFLALEAPIEGSIRLGLELDGREVVWWSLRD